MYYKVLYMDSQHQPQTLETLRDIKRMMERSSRFISLSGWSGISAGICALLGAWFAHNRLLTFGQQVDINEYYTPNAARPSGGAATHDLFIDLLIIAIATFIAAAVSAFIFTFIRSRRHGVPIWDRTVQRLAWNTIIPMVAGGIMLLRAIEFRYYELVAPGCLIFYGLALVNASKYTLGEIRYLGYGQIILGILNLWIINEGLYFWAAGFGILHIVYGAIMWWKYEK